MTKAESSEFSGKELPNGDESDGKLKFFVEAEDESGQKVESFSDMTVTRMTMSADDFVTKALADQEADMENDSPQDVSNAIMARGDVLKGFPETENTKKLKSDSVNKLSQLAGRDDAIMARGDVLKGFPETENTKKLKTDSVNKL